jgi:Cyclic phosphodiesterase-like protein
MALRWFSRLSLASELSSAATPSSPAATENSDNDAKNFKFSIWLLPSSQDPARSTLMNMIQEFSQRETASVPFPPHVTLVGGIQCPSLEFFQNVFVPKLQERIAAAGGNGADAADAAGNDDGGGTSRKSIDCQFQTQPEYKNVWNQATVLVMEESDEFTHVVDLCRKVVSEVLPSSVNRQDEKKFLHGYPPPLRKPHMSLYYGSLEFAPSPKEIMQRLGGPGNFSFQGNQIAIWKTEPSNTQGVASWKELIIINL